MDLYYLHFSADWPQATLVDFNWQNSCKGSRIKESISSEVIIGKTGH